MFRCNLERVVGAVVAAALAALPCGTAVAAAQPAPDGARAELVRLDVVVADAHGQLVRDLTDADFELLEDGKPQRVSHFLFVGRGGTATPATPAGTAASPAAPAAAPAAQGMSGSPRQIVIVVDDLHIAPNNLRLAKDALARFVLELVQPDDRVALITTGSAGGVQRLTADRSGLAAAIDGLRSREAFVGPARGTQLTPVQAEMLLRGDRSALRLAAWVLIAEPGSAFDNTPRAAVEGAGSSGAAGAAAVAGDSKERAAEREAQRQADAVLAEATRFSAATLSTLAEVIRSLAELPGRKLCLVVSDGFLLGKGTRSDQTRSLQTVIDAATRSGAVVYTLDSRGLALTGGDASVAGAASPPGLQQQVDGKAAQVFRETLSQLAGDTGGFLVHGTNEATPGLRRMLADNEAYYLMAYEPANVRRDGHFRRIELRLPRHPDFAVRTRSGYFAPDDRGGSKDAARGRVRAAIDEAAAREALEAALPATGVPVRLTVDYVDLPPLGSQAVVRAHVDVAGLRWREAEGRRRAEIDLIGGVYDPAGAPIGSPFSRHVDLDLTPAQYERARKVGLQYQQQVALPPGRFEVRLVVAGPGPVTLGGAAQSVEIPNLAEGKLTLSSVFLSSTAAPSGSDAAPDPDGSRVETPRDAQVRRLFGRGETLFFQLYVYNASGAESGSSDLVLQAQIRAGEKLVSASKPQPVSFRRQDGAPLPQSNAVSLEGFDPGRYELRVVVVDRKANATVFRNVTFTVE